MLIERLSCWSQGALDSTLSATPVGVGKAGSPEFLDVSEHQSVDEEQLALEGHTEQLGQAVSQLRAEAAETDKGPRYVVDPTRKGDCPNCHWLKEGKMRTIAWTEKDKIEFAKDPAKKTAHIVKMLGQLRHQSDHQNAAVVKDINRDKHLLKLYDILKGQLKSTIKKINGFVPMLPSEDKTYIDASGKHWGPVEYKDGRHYLIDEQKASLRKDAKKNKKKLKFKNLKGMGPSDSPQDPGNILCCTAVWLC